jgi:superfamily I DNA/RNA helicase
MTMTLLREREDIRSKVQAQFAYIFVDEYQDLNFGQYELVKLISKDSHIVVIGDPDQSIYGFRGSDNKYFKSFEQDFPGCEQIFLNQNYRSTQTILDASFQMISRSGEAGERTRIFSDQSRTRRLVIKEAATEQSEALAVGRMIENLMGGTSFFSMDTGKSGDDDQKEYSFADFAVLVRTSRQTEAFIRMFEQQGIPYQAADKKKWMEMDGIRQLISICRIMAGCASFIDFDIVFDHFIAGLGKKGKTLYRAAMKNARARQADVLESLASRDMMDVRGELGQQIVGAAKELAALRGEIKDKDNESAITLVCRRAGLSKTIEANDKTKQGFERLLAVARLHPELKGFLDGVTLNQDPDVLEFNAERVSLMTIHAAKGLEFPVVFVAGCEQGLVPFARDNENIDDIEEERRLFYVAMTRAMDILCLTYAGKRSIYGSIKKRQRSFFIEDIEKKLTRMEKRPVLAAAKKRESQLELF